MQPFGQAVVYGRPRQTDLATGIPLPSEGYDRLRECMMFTYVNKRGVAYYVHEMQTKAGTHRFVVRRMSEGALAELPDGMEIVENVNGQALARAGAAGDHVAVARAGLLDGFGLVLVKAERLVIRRAEDAGGLRMHRPAPGQLVHARRPGIGWADLEQNVRPQSRFSHQRLLDELPRLLVGDCEERPDEVAVVSDDLFVQVKKCPCWFSKERLNVLSFAPRMPGQYAP